VAHLWGRVPERSGNGGVPRDGVAALAGQH